MGYGGVEDIILTILAILVIVILLGTIYSIIRAIIQFIFSNGDAGKIKKAWDSIRYTIIGIIITVFLLFFLPMIFSRITPSGGLSYSAKAILTRSMDIGRKILSIGGLYSYPTQSNTTPRNIDNSSPSNYTNTPL